MTDTVVEVYLGGERLATHRLFPACTANAYSTNESDMPQGRSYSDWDAGRIRRWAARVGESCADVVDRVFASVRFDEQGFNAALAVLRLSHRYGTDRLERACSMALSSGIRSPRYRHIEPILATNQDKPSVEFRNMLLELMERRYDTHSTIFCTQFKKKDWHSRLGGGVHADAIMDRIVHNAVWVGAGEVNMREKMGEAMRQG